MKHLSLLALALAAVSASAQTTLFESGHADMEVNYEGGTLNMGWHDDFAPTEAEEEKDPSEFYLFQGPAALTTRAEQFIDGSAYNFIGAGANDPIFYFPDFTTTDVTLLGLSGEEVPTGTFLSGKPGGSATYFPEDTRTGLGFNTGGNIQFKLTAFSGPGNFSLFKQYGGFVRNWMSTADGISDLDSAYVLGGLGHTDYNVAFTQPGIYDITLTASAYLPNGTRVFSEPTTFRYGINEVVPEPASMAVLGLGLAALKRRRKN